MSRFTVLQNSESRYVIGVNEMGVPFKFQVIILISDVGRANGLMAVRTRDTNYTIINVYQQGVFVRTIII
mgnify:FL=1